MSNQLLSLGVSGGGNTEAFSGKLNLMYGNTGDHHLLEISTSGDLYQDLSVWNFGVLLAYLDKDATEWGAYVSTDFTNSAFGPYWRPYWPIIQNTIPGKNPPDDKKTILSWGPMAGVDIGRGVETTPGRFGVSSADHANQTAYCPADGTGIFGDDNTVGGCDNRPTSSATTEDSVEETEEVSWSLGATAMLMGWWDITDQWKLDAGIGASIAILPEFGVSFVGMVRGIHKF